MVAIYDFFQKAISQLFEELLGWKSEFKLISPKYVTGTHFGTNVAILDISYYQWILELKVSKHNSWYMIFYATYKKGAAGPKWLPNPLQELELLVYSDYVLIFFVVWNFLNSNQNLYYFFMNFGLNKSLKH